MDLKKEKNDATKKKGMALSDDALAGVTGGGYWVVKYRTPEGEIKQTTILDNDLYEEWTEKHSDYEIISKESSWGILFKKILRLR